MTKCNGHMVSCNNMFALQIVLNGAGLDLQETCLHSEVNKHLPDSRYVFMRVIKVSHKSLSTGFTQQTEHVLSVVIQTLLLPTNIYLQMELVCMKQIPVNTDILIFTSTLIFTIIYIHTT